MSSGMSFTNFAEAKILNAVLRATAFTPPTNLYLALFTSAPTDAGGGTECGYTGYARQLSAWAAPVVQSSGSQCTETSALTFAAPAASLNLAAVGLYDAATGGNLWAYLPYGMPVAVAAGQPIVAAANALTYLLD